MAVGPAWVACQHPSCLPALAAAASPRKPEIHHPCRAFPLPEWSPRSQAVAEWHPLCHRHSSRSSHRPRPSRGNSRLWPSQLSRHPKTISCNSRSSLCWHITFTLGVSGFNCHPPQPPRPPEVRCLSMPIPATSLSKARLKAQARLPAKGIQELVRVTCLKVMVKVMHLKVMDFRGREWPPPQVI